jgi:FkbM family methyltransferase
MLKFARNVVRHAVGTFGYDVGRSKRWPGVALTRRAPEMGRDSMKDLVRVLRSLGWDSARPPVIFDVGANNGGTVERMRKVFRDPVIHAFEPGPQTFEALRAATAGLPNVTINPIALGAAVEDREFVEHESSANSSFLRPDRECQGETVRTVKMHIGTVDDYCAANKIDAIDVLKIDTQGFDMEVIRGAERMIRAGKVGVVYTEIIFAALYEGQASLDQFYRHLVDRGFQLVGFYEFAHRNDRAGWCDAMFARAR